MASTAALQVLQGVMGAVGLFGLLWGAATAAQGTSAEDYREMETHLLRYERYLPTSSVAALDTDAEREISSCDIHAQHALLLLEIPLADAALRAGSVQEFDRHTAAIEARVRVILSCVPRDALAWLAAFGLAVGHGQIDQHTFDLLAASYETSRNEAWISVRRVPLAASVISIAPAPIREQILAEFRKLILDGFLEVPARAYLSASERSRILLETEIDQLDPASRKKFTETIASFDQH